MTVTTVRQRRRLPLVLRNRAFGAVWLGQVLTQAAVRMFQVGVSWWLVAYAVGAGRGLASGLFMAVSTLPAVALAPVVARAVSRLAHRSVLRTAAATAGAAVLLLALVAYGGAPPTVAAYAATLVLASCQAFFDPCLTTSVPELVDDEDIEAATGFELSTQSLASLGGALLGALIVDEAGMTGLAAGCAAAYLAAALLVTTVRFRPAVAQEPQEPQDGAESGAGAARGLREVLAGLPAIRKILVCFAAANLFTTAVFVVIPLYTKSELGGGGSTVALLEAGLGTGTLLGSVTGARVPGRPTRLGAGLLAVMAAAFALAGLVAGRLVLAGCLVVAGWCVGVIGVRFVALFQRLVPPADKPGFFAVMQAVLGASFPVASLLFGLLGDHLPARTLCLVQAAGLVPAAIALALLREPGADDRERGPADVDRQPHPSDPSPEFVATGGER
ncbi:MFS transporter [Streptomyces chattanoogensis]|uniref:Major facilitator superfamily protein n=1 Tax=Streptomyces chattanoogensis TaxID=66876 RepID=A0A0N0XWR6_9ACTN|nr:MFS transporter [Streptomyces chattanoogensis]KPC61843.1 major facilitator superfamily protein [Streptomyces chattanoogensis]